MEIEYVAITTKKVGRIWIATAEITKPFKAETNMQGKTEAIAIEKLKLFLNNKPYSHLDN